MPDRALRSTVHPAAAAKVARLSIRSWTVAVLVEVLWATRLLHQEGGKLGNLPYGKLYPQLDAALFTLSAGQVSAPIETELGFHLLLCEHIYPAQQVSLTKAKAQIRTQLQERAQRNCQKEWLKQLQTTTPEVSS